jgi:hypothetical protein
MSNNPYAKVIDESLQELEELAIELQSNQASLPFRLSFLTQCGKDLQHIAAKMDSLEEQLQFNPERQREIHDNYQDELARIAELSQIIEYELKNADWFRGVLRTSQLPQIVDGIITINKFALWLLESVGLQDSWTTQKLHETVYLLETEVKVKMLTG